MKKYYCRNCMSFHSKETMCVNCGQKKLQEIKIRLYYQRPKLRMNTKR